MGLQIFFFLSFLGIMLSQSNGQTVPKFVCSTGKRFDSKMFLVVSLVETGDAKTRLGGGPQMTHWKVARY